MRLNPHLARRAALALTLSISLGFFAFSAHATPAAPPAATSVSGTPSFDTTEAAVPAERSLLGQLNTVRQNVGDRASRLVENAMGFLGVRYRRGGNSEETGFDCSGFVRATYEQTIGLLLPRKAEQQAAATQKIDRTELKPGDLVFFNTMRRAFSHVGIYVGNDQFIHAPRAGATVRVENMGMSYWARRFDGARRVNGNGSNGDSAPALTAQQAQALMTLAPAQGAMSPAAPTFQSITGAESIR